MAGLVESKPKLTSEKIMAQNKTYFRSTAPLRLGLAGGGTDVSPYSDLYGGAILNATVGLYVHATLEPLDNRTISFCSKDLGESEDLESAPYLELNGKVDLMKAVYNRIVKDFTKKPLSFKLTTFVDVPKGSGLGTSSTVTVAILGAFVEWLKLPLGEYDIARLAYSIEREDVGLAGGKQDQYAATFGGFNFMEFAQDKVIVNPLRIKKKYRKELEFNLLLYYTGTNRESAKIIKNQVQNFSKESDQSIEAAHYLKEHAYKMKEALLLGNLHRLGTLLDESWQKKKMLSPGITNPVIDDLYETALNSGATGGKISGAGGGGFMFFYCPEDSRYRVKEALSHYGGKFVKFTFTSDGLYTWKSK